MVLALAVCMRLAMKRSWQLNRLACGAGWWLPTLSQSTCFIIPLFCGACVGDQSSAAAVKQTSRSPSCFEESSPDTVASWVTEAFKHDKRVFCNYESRIPREIGRIAAQSFQSLLSENPLFIREEVIRYSGYGYVEKYESGYLGEMAELATENMVQLLTLAKRNTHKIIFEEKYQSIAKKSVGIRYEFWHHMVEAHLESISKIMSTLSANRSSYLPCKCQRTSYQDRKSYYAYTKGVPPIVKPIPHKDPPTLHLNKILYSFGFRPTIFYDDDGSDEPQRLPNDQQANPGDLVIYRHDQLHSEPPMLEMNCQSEAGDQPLQEDPSIRVTLSCSC